MKEKRIEYIDLLRILSAFAVVFIHVIDQHFDISQARNTTWSICNIYDSLARFAVPIFVMISGALFLSKDYSIKDIYFKKILRIIIAFGFWSLVYLLIFNENLSIRKSIYKFFIGHWHMWFLFMICGLYMLVPFFKIITSSKKLTEYYIILSLIFTSILPLISTILSEFNIITIPTLINIRLDQFKLSFGYSGYFLLGYYLKENDISKLKRRIIYILGICATIFTILMTKISHIQLEFDKLTYHNELYLNIFMQSIAIFIFAKYHFKSNNFIKNIANCCFGIYLVHVIFTSNIHLRFNIGIALSIPVTSIIIFTFSLTICHILSKIPILNKYII